MVAVTMKQNNSIITTSTKHFRSKPLYVTNSS